MFWWKWNAESEDGIVWFYTRFCEQVNAKQVLTYASQAFPKIRPLSAVEVQDPTHGRVN